MQPKLEYALAVEVLLLREALGLHEDLEVQWSEIILGEASSAVPQAVSSEQSMCLEATLTRYHWDRQPAQSAIPNCLLLAAHLDLRHLHQPFDLLRW